MQQKIIWAIQRPTIKAASPYTVRSSDKVGSSASLSSNLEAPSQSMDSLPHELKRNTPVVMMEAKLRQQHREPQVPARARAWKFQAPRIISIELAASKSIVVPAKA